MQPITLTGLTANDVRTGDRHRYHQLTSLLEAELQPEGALEVLYAAEILRANWRLQLYACLEEGAETEAARTWLDRARSHANTLLRRNTAELRRLQTDRLAKAELALDLPRLINLKDYLQFIRGTEKRKNEPNPTGPATSVAAKNNPAPTDPGPTDIDTMETLLMQDILKAQESQMPQEMKKQTQSQPRNEQCACGSGGKFKRCCGHWSKAA
jgi:SEC-C motif